ncbi:hypothetical protein [Escherichia coli IS9]|nr:hypothetical protein [Escherichia coli IS9]
MPVLSLPAGVLSPATLFRSTAMTRVSGLIINRVYPDIMG